jgi:ADP-ribose pyrophosphatase
MPDTKPVAEPDGPDSTAGSRLLSRETVFDGRLLRLYVDRIRLEDGREALREVVEHPGAVAVIARDDSDAVLLVRQYRHAVGRSMWEIPAGKLEPGETALACAQRELAEETGRNAGRWAILGSFFTTPGFSNERISLFLASELVAADRPPDDDVSACVAASRSDLRDMLARGELVDAKTLLGLQWVGLLSPSSGGEGA